MAKRIIGLVRAKKASMKKNPAEAGQNAALAITAIRGGIRSMEWRSYMMQFVEQNPPGTPVDPRQLDRLLATDGTLGHPVLDLRRAYLVAAGPCGVGTTDRFDYEVNSIDEGLDVTSETCPADRHDRSLGVVSDSGRRNGDGLRGRNHGKKKNKRDERFAHLDPPSVVRKLVRAVYT